MNSQLFIADRIKVGFQKRKDCFTGQLGYIIYYDKKNVLRKEKSWEGWRHKDIDPIELDNKPHSGFVINKDVRRSSDWFSSGRTMVRVWDSRGFEFEITTGNLLFILMTVDCSKRGLTGEFVYAWWGTELVLLPTECEEYKNCQEFTNLQAGKVGSKDMVAGCFYETKRQEELYYLGKLPWFEWKQVKQEAKIKTSYSDRKYDRVSEKKHVFLRKGRLEVYSMPQLARRKTMTPDVNLGAGMDIYDKSVHSEIEGLQIEPLVAPQSAHYNYWDRHFDWALENGSYNRYLLNGNRYKKGEKDFETLYTRELSASYKVEAGKIVKTFARTSTTTPYSYYSGYPNRSAATTYYTEEEMKTLQRGKICVKLKNGAVFDAEHVCGYYALR